MTFVFDGAMLGAFEADPDQRPTEKQASVIRLKIYYPELKHWNDMAFLEAWKAFFADVIGVAPAHDDIMSAHWLLCYLYIRQINPDFDFSHGRYFEEIKIFADLYPWSAGIALPSLFQKIKRPPRSFILH